ncbi:hypothetical protein [Candidatus Phytoplasma pruni]|uniref:Uncharacterized protein n=1 Tax=Candidatus Phytoplasma pruni TaxID=479893 RepID=A0A851HC74_9MOLU|nr:hypothetical protein [Candidatus Phytoplasma pruni]NWN45675.1 hypothetical protein [Candidatus Phytoplasma pruni]
MPKQRMKNTIGKEYEDQKFTFEIRPEKFIKGGLFSFDIYEPSKLFNIIIELNNYKQFTWKEIMNDNSFHFHKLEAEKENKGLIEQNCEDMHKQTADQEVYQIKIIGEERLFFYYSKGICYPIAYDEFHLMYKNAKNKNKKTTIIQKIIREPIVKIKANLNFKYKDIFELIDPGHYNEYETYSKFKPRIKEYFEEAKQIIENSQAKMEQLNKKKKN